MRLASQLLLLLILTAPLADHPPTVPEWAAGLTDGDQPSVSLGRVHHLHGEPGGEA